METITLKLYCIEELSEDAKEKALKNIEVPADYLWYDALPGEVKEILEMYCDGESNYETCGQLQQELEHISYTIDYGLDAEPFNLRRV